MNKETCIQNKILVLVSQIDDSFFWRNNTGAAMIKGRLVNFGYPGSPDIIGVVKGKFVGIEVKTKDKNSKQRESQQNFERILKLAGGIYIMPRSPEEAMDMLKQNNVF